ncbi:MAG: hypothetical protein EA376_13095 [Phycisphaeraceae bacterium]|nr:MAG: hypothetical protein EA376_13095 [Phycisphaeraceae bacterium]
MIPRPLHPCFPLLAAFAAIGAAAHAQAPAQPAQPGAPTIPGTPDAATAGGLVPVDQGFADLDLLSTSLRHLQLGSREDLGFERLFTVPGHPDLLMRRDGAMTAIFHRSLYEETRDGTVALIPDGAIFHLGPLDDNLLATMTGRGLAGVGSAAGRRTPDSAGARADGRVSSMVSPMKVERPGRDEGPVVFPTFLTPPAPAPNAGQDDPEADIEAPTIWNNEVYRRMRLQSLLRNAARADRP